MDVPVSQRNGTAQAMTPALPAPQPDKFDAAEVVGILKEAMTRVMAHECSPATLNAACNAAARITDLLKVHLELRRLERRRD